MKGHFAKQCPKRKTTKMISHIQDVIGISISDDNVESVFYMDEETNIRKKCAIKPFVDSLDQGSDTN